jgi:integrase
MSLYKREGSPFWWYSFNLDGIRFRGSTGETGRREALRVEDGIKQNARRKRKLGKEWTLHDALNHYWNDHAKDTRGSKTTLAKLAKLREHLGEKTLIADLKSADIMDYRAKRRGEGLKPHSINRDIATLQAAMNHAHELYGQPPVNIPWGRVKVEEPAHRTRFLSREEYDALMLKASANLRPIIAFAVATGLRKGNILSLTWDQVNMSAGRVNVLLKGNKRHSVRITPPVRALLSTLGERVGKVFDTTNFRREWAKAVKGAKLKDFRFHDLRHTNASWARIAGADLADICDALGHSGVAVTMRYAHLTPDTEITAFERVSNVLWSQSASQANENAGK